VTIAFDQGCAILPLCDEEANCQIYNDELALNSTSRPDPAVDMFYCADDFTPSENGSITSPCWQGVYSGVALNDSFRVRYYEDADGFPGAVIGDFSQSAGTLTGLTRDWTGLQILSDPPADIYQYTADHAAVPVEAGTCYWIEISNDIAPDDFWYWQAAEDGAMADDIDNPLPREGNGRCMQDGVGDDVNPPDGYEFTDIRAGDDLSFCIGVPLAEPACDFYTMFDTGPHEPVLFNGSGSNLGWSSGNLDPPQPPGCDGQRRCVQAFTMPPLPAAALATEWTIEQLGIEGFDPGGVTNEFINYEIFTRTSLEVPPVPADSVLTIEEVPFDSSANVDAATTEVILLLGRGDLTLPPGDYWLTFWASNSTPDSVPADFAWFTNAPDGINVACTVNFPPPADPCVPPTFEGCLPSDPDGQPAGYRAMFRARMYPVPGFGAYTLTPEVLDVNPDSDPTPDPADLHNAAMRFRGTAYEAGTCPEDCDGSNDNLVDILDFLAVLAQWGEIGGTCDMGLGDPGVGINEFLAVLGQWGTCP
jgi:hypothetical protein